MWRFQSTFIKPGDNIAVEFEYSNQGVIYTLSYIITREKIINVTVASAFFSGDINLSNDYDGDHIQNEYLLTPLENNAHEPIVDIVYNSLVDNTNITSNGLFIVPKDGIYTFSVSINYSYPALTNTSLNSSSDAPYYTLSKITGSPGSYIIDPTQLATGYLPLMNYNSTSLDNFSQISNGTVTINTILKLTEGTQIGLVYNNLYSDDEDATRIESNVEINNGYFNVVRVA